MPNRFMLSAFLLISLVLLTITGCLSSGSQTVANVQSESPEAAVGELLSSWRQQSGPVFVVSPSGTIVPSESASIDGVSYIRFKDLSGNVWSLALGEITYQSVDFATVNVYYYSISAEHGGLKIVFKMVRDQGQWLLDDFIVTALPAVVVTGTGVKGVISDSATSLPVVGARVEAYLQGTSSIVGAAVTAENGFYSIVDLSPGSYYLVVARDGYEPYTISGIVVN